MTLPSAVLLSCRRVPALKAIAVAAVVLSAAPAV